MTDLPPVDELAEMVRDVGISQVVAVYDFDWQTVVKTLGAAGYTRGGNRRDVVAASRMPTRPRDTQEWSVGGVCAQVDPELFFPEEGCSSEAARRLCVSCGFAAECLKYALDHNEEGVWGGSTERERQRMRRRIRPATRMGRHRQRHRTHRNPASRMKILWINQYPNLHQLWQDETSPRCGNTIGDKTIRYNRKAPPV